MPFATQFSDELMRQPFVVLAPSGQYGHDVLFMVQAPKPAALDQFVAWVHAWDRSAYGGVRESA